MPCAVIGRAARWHAGIGQLIVRCLTFSVSDRCAHSIHQVDCLQLACHFCAYAVQVLQNANTVTVDKVLLANGSAGHIVDFVTIVRFYTCSCTHEVVLIDALAWQTPKYQRKTVLSC
jgi:hypothetical protein